MPLNPQVKPLLDSLGITALPGIETLTPQAARDRFTTFAEIQKQMGVEQIHEVRDIKVPGPAGEITLRIFAPDIPKPAPALIYFHGGGWVVGSLDFYNGLCRTLANQAQCIVLSVDYRLAPESKFPAAVDDCYAATEWIAKNASVLGIDPDRIAVGGDSAGGNLATVTSRLARDRGGPKLAHQLLIYPATNMHMTAPSIGENADAPILTKAAILWFIDHYLSNSAEKEDPLASPLLAQDLRGLPSAFVITAECDPLRDEGQDYACRLQKAGVDTEHICYAGMPHGFLSFGAALETTKQAIADATLSIRRAFGTLHADSAA